MKMSVLMLSILCAGACLAKDPDSMVSDQLENFTVETSDDGAIRQISKLQNTSSVSPEGAPGDVLIDKAGCTHIRFCNAPGPDEVICDTDDNLSCSRSQRFNECVSDANAVCGNWTNMRFDPPI